MRGAVQVRGDAPFDREGVERCEQADGSGGGPERERLVLEDETAYRRPDEEADLPRRARERHVTAEQLRLGEIDHERRIDRAVQALREGEDTDGDAEDDRRLRSREPGAAREHPEKRSRPDDAHQSEAAQAPLALDELHDR